MNNRVDHAVKIAKAVVVYRIGEKLLGLRPYDDYDLNLEPICVVGNLTQAERDDLYASLEALNALAASRE